MIIKLDQYRDARNARKEGARDATANPGECETYETRRLFGNTVPKMSLREIREEALKSLSLALPDSFENFNAREFIVHTYALATTI